MRRAIDTYHFVVTVKAPQLESTASGDVAAKGWPEELEDLVEGIDLGLGADKRLRFLRRIPDDPLTGEPEWGKRSSSQDPDDDLWDSTNVFDVFSLAEGEGLDGTPYVEW
jgi:general secretion pathway protein G